MAREHDTITVYKDARNEWRWRRQASNGEVVGASGEGYQDKDHAIRMASELNIEAAHNLTVESGDEE